MRHILSLLICLLSFSLSAQNIWNFSGKHMRECDEIWLNNHYFPVTESGKGRLSAKDANGNDLAYYEIMHGRPVARPFVPGCYYLFEVPTKILPAGSFVDFNATFTIEDGAPMEWVLEVEDGGKWKICKSFMCYGPAFGKDDSHTYIYQTVRIEEGVENMIRFRIKASDGFMRPTKNKMEERGAMFVSGPHLGAMVKDFGSNAPKDTLKVLCLGNSFTYFYGSPTMLKEIAWNEGHFIDVNASLKGGWNMGQHLSLQTTNDLIQEGGYDYMILQDQSLVPAKVGHDPNGMYSKIKEMEAMATKVRTTSPDCKAIVENTWAYWKYNFGGFKSIDDFDENGIKGAMILAEAVEDAQISPIANAFRIVRNERPDINLYDSDMHHQSILGSYLKSCINYLILFNEPFGDSPADCLQDPEVTAYLRDVAERVVLN